MKKSLLLTTVILMTFELSAQIIHVPNDYSTIQEGINAATNGDTVLVDNGTYYENINFLGKAITVASNYILDGDTNHINNTIIDGSQATNPDSASCVMLINGEDTTSILNGFTLTGGSGTVNQTWQVRAGGGVYARNSGGKIVNNKIQYNTVEDIIAGGAGIQFLTDPIIAWAIIDNNTISHNTSIAHGMSAFGGGMSITANAKIKNNLIEYNACINDVNGTDGGGIEIERMPGSAQLDISISNNMINNNSLNGINNALGAGIMSLSASALINNNIITNNEATCDTFAYGGGLYVYNSSAGALIYSNMIENNYCTGDYSYGGGIVIRKCVGTRILDNEINNNIVTGPSVAGGGGIWLDNPLDSTSILRNNMIENKLIGNGFGGGCVLYYANVKPTQLSSNVIKGNISGNVGGGIFTFNSFNLSVCNNIIQEDSASYQGGGIFMRYYAGDKSPFKSFTHYGDLGNEETLRGITIYHPTIINNTIYDNSAMYGGAIYTDLEDEFPIFMNNIFWENYASQSYDEIYNPSGAHLPIFSCDIDTNEVDGPWYGKNNFYADPVFLDPECHLAWQSSCIGAGIENLDLGDTTYCCPSEDFEGDPRPLCDGPDVGADETDIGSGINNLINIRPNIIISPNPSHGWTNIEYQLTERKEVIIKLFSMRGELVEQQAFGLMKEGDHAYTLDLSHLPDGIYLIRLQAGDEVETAKIVLRK